jgi:hypothetical protein
MDGWRPDGERRLIERDGITVDEMRYLRPLSWVTYCINSIRHMSPPGGLGYP